MTDAVLEIEEQWLRRSEADNARLGRAWQAAAPLEWGGWLLRQSAPLFGRDELDAAPHEPGIYALWGSDFVLLYVGKATSLSARLNTHWLNSRHRRSGWWDQFSFCLVPEFALQDVEVAHIHALTPPQNKLYEPQDWPGHDAMVAAINREWR